MVKNMQESGVILLLLLLLESSQPMNGPWSKYTVEQLKWELSGAYRSMTTELRLEEAATAKLIVALGLISEIDPFLHKEIQDIFQTREFPIEMIFAINPKQLVYSGKGRCAYSFVLGNFNDRKIT